MNRVRVSGVLAAIAVVLILVGGFESGWFAGTGTGVTNTTTSTSLTTTSQAQQSVKITTVGNTTYYAFNFCSLPTGVMPSDWASVRNKPGWSVQGCNLAYLGNSTGYVGAYYTGREFSNFTFSVTAISLGYCPSDPTGAIGGQLPPVLVMTFRQQNTIKLNEYFFHLDIGKAQIIKEVNGTPIVIANRQPLGPPGPGGTPLGPSGRYTMTVTVRGDTINATWYGPLFNGGITQGSIATTDSSFSTGSIGVTTYNCNAAFTNIEISTPAG
jgi:hypothetical protein